MKFFKDWYQKGVDLYESFKQDAAKKAVQEAMPKVEEALNPVIKAAKDFFEAWTPKKLFGDFFEAIQSFFKIIFEGIGHFFSSIFGSNKNISAKKDTQENTQANSSPEPTQNMTAAAAAAPETAIKSSSSQHKRRTSSLPPSKKDSMRMTAAPSRASATYVENPMSATTAAASTPSPSNTNVDTTSTASASSLLSEAKDFISARSDKISQYVKAKLPIAAESVMQRLSSFFAKSSTTPTPSATIPEKADSLASSPEKTSTRTHCDAMPAAVNLTTASSVEESRQYSGNDCV